jgi:NhaP-type Na+/H+ or K+/H+ antiporter
MQLDTSTGNRADHFLKGQGITIPDSGLNFGMHHLMDQFVLSIFILGLVTVSMAWMPAISKKLGISYSVFYLIGGIFLYSLFPEKLPSPMPKDNEEAILHLTELIVIISLMGAGIKIDRSFSLKKWSLPLRLVFIAMLLCIGSTVVLGYLILDLNLAAAILLGAVLAPTDPVLASDVQVSHPNEEKEPRTRFALTSEAGINDGLAFPFTWLAVTVASLAAGQNASLLHWFSYHLVYQIVAGIIMGYAAGKLAGYVIFDLSRKYKYLESLDGFFAVSLTLLVYGVTEMIHGYGFMAVFVSALALRDYEKSHKYHKTMHEFTDQIEKLFVAVLLVLLGGAIAMGILDDLTWQTAVFVLLFLLVIRPVMAYLSLMGTTLTVKERWAIGFLGIRGMGSIFYLAFAFGEIGFDHEEELWSTMVLTVALSVIIHGLSAVPIMRKVSN